MKNTMVFECADTAKCGYKWSWDVNLPMVIEAFIARVRAESICPICGKKGAFILLGDRYYEALKELEGG